MGRWARANREAGYTLLEMLVALAILAGIMSITLVSWNGRRSDERLDVVADKIRIALVETRTDASRAATPKSLHIDLDKREWRTDGGQAGHIPDTIDLTVTSVWDHTSARQAEFRFMPEGSSTGGTIKLTENSEVILVTVDWLTGRIAVAEQHD